MLKLNLKLQSFGHLMWTDSLEKPLKLGKIEGGRRRGRQRMRLLGWHHWLNGHEFEQAAGVGDGQGGLARCSPWGHRVGHDCATELNWDVNFENTNAMGFTECNSKPKFELYYAAILMQLFISTKILISLWFSYMNSSYVFEKICFFSFVFKFLNLFYFQWDVLDSWYHGKLPCIDFKYKC